MNAANSRSVLKFSNLVSSARTAVAVPSPIPGTLISNLNFSFIWISENNFFHSLLQFGENL